MVVTLPIRSRSHTAVERIVGSIKRLNDHYVLTLKCKGFPEKIVDCRFRSYRLERKKARVRDVLSGLTLTITIPVLVLDDCSVEPYWDGSRLVWSCESFENCCKRL